MPEKAFSVCIKDSVFIDPACGSGSLLLKAAKVLGKDAVRQGFYGQEINITTYNLCNIVSYIIDDFDTKTMRNAYYSLKGQRANGFNSMFAVSSIPMAKKYYLKFKSNLKRKIKI